MQPTPEQLSRLPQWAQKHIEDLDRRVVLAERALKEYNDKETPSEFYYDDFLCVGPGSPELLRHYVQTNKITIHHDGIQVDVLVRDNEPEIEIAWSDPTRLCREVAMVPKSFQQIKIIHPSNIR